jgi:hypothetical protein
MKRKRELVRIRQQTPAYSTVRQHTSAYASLIVMKRKRQLLLTYAPIQANIKYMCEAEAEARMLTYPHVC